MAHQKRIMEITGKKSYYVSNRWQKWIEICLQEQKTRLPRRIPDAGWRHFTSYTAAIKITNSNIGAGGGGSYVCAEVPA